jgi:conjugative relaxase-like TrwC/TraI family protein
VGGVANYYADSAGESPGIWLGRGATGLGLKGEVKGADLRSLLEGKDPRSQETLIGAQGSAGRAGGPTNRFDDREWWTLREAGEVIGVSSSYLRRLVDQTRLASAERAFALMAGQALAPAPALWLVAEKHGRTWRLSGRELADYMNLRKPPTVVVGYDVTFSVEKSVSALWARADGDVRSEIVAAVDASVVAGVDYLERQALRVQVGGKRQEGRGMIAASYLHSTSRALDPQLHRHVVIANLASGPGGQVRTLDGMSLFHHAKTAGYVAGAELRHQLTARLGTEWQPVIRGLSEVAGVGDEVIAAISTRSKDMAAAALAIESESNGAILTGSASSRQALALATRSPKVGGTDPASLQARWTATLDAAGLDAEVFSQVLHRVAGPTLTRTEDVAGLFEDLGGAHGVTETQAAFDRRHVVQAVTSWSIDRLSAAACEDLADRWLASPEVVPLRSTRARSIDTDIIRRNDGQIVRGATELRFSTRSMLAIESRIESNYLRGSTLDRGRVPWDVVEDVLARPAFSHLSSEQRDLVRQLTTSGHETNLVHGPAGTGKTTAIEAAARAWELAGYRVLGASVNGNAAEVLGRSAGIDSTTVASMLWRLAGGDGTILDHNTVVVLDEATTLGTRELDQLLIEIHGHGSALSLVGDPAQHSAVGAGGAFRFLMDQFPDDVERLTINRRQLGEHLSEVRLALDEYRSGAITSALERLESNQRVITAESAYELFDTLVSDWYVDRMRTIDEPEFDRSSMTAAHHDERRALVDRARSLLRADGTLHGPEIVAGGTRFCAGDEVIAKVPDRSLRPIGGDRQSFLKNGSKGIVLDVENDSLTIDFEHRGVIRVPRSYVDQDVGHGAKGALLHSYCLTTYAAQGDTYGAARHLGTDHSSRAELYVGLTRGRHETALYAVRRSDVVVPIVDDDLPRLRDDTNAARAMAASAAAGGVERLARELDPLAIEATSMADGHSARQLREALRSAEPSRLPLAQRAYEIATERLVAQALSEPPGEVLQFLGPRPGLNDTADVAAPGPTPRDVWDEAVRSVTLYRAEHDSHSFPSDNPTDELIGLRGLSLDVDAWDRTDAAVSHQIATMPMVEVALTQEVGLTIEMEL